MSMLTIFIGYFGIGLFMQTLFMAKDMYFRQKFGLKTMTVEKTGLWGQIKLRVVEALLWPIEIIMTIAFTCYLRKSGKVPQWYIDAFIEGKDKNED